MRKAILAGVLLLLAIVWVVTGFLGEETIDTHPSLEALAQSQETRADLTDLPTVRASVSRASTRSRYITVTGETENLHTVKVVSKTSGQVVARPVENGSSVSLNDTLCALEPEDRRALVDQAQANLKVAKLNFDGSKRLQEQGLQGESAQSLTAAALRTAEANLLRRQLDLEYATIRSPLSGYVETTHAQVGDYLNVNSPCVTVIDLDPMLVVAEVIETSVKDIKIDAQATVTLADNREVQGPVTFIGKQSNINTRTFRVEITLNNENVTISSGLSAEVSIPIETVEAHLIPSSLFVLDDEGNMGVRVVDSSKVVSFKPVEIVADESNLGVWVTGLPSSVTLITVGQDFVSPGEKVNIQLVSGTELPVVRSSSGS